MVSFKTTGELRGARCEMSYPSFLGSLGCAGPGSRTRPWFDQGCGPQTKIFGPLGSRGSELCERWGSIFKHNHFISLAPGLRTASPPPLACLALIDAAKKILCIKSGKEQ